MCVCVCVCVCVLVIKLAGERNRGRPEDSLFKHGTPMNI